MWVWHCRLCFPAVACAAIRPALTPSRRFDAVVALLLFASIPPLLAATAAPQAGNTALNCAAEEGNLDVLKALISFPGVDLEVRGEVRSHTSMGAALRGCIGHDAAPLTVAVPAQRNAQSAAELLAHALRRRARPGKAIPPSRYILSRPLSPRVTPSRFCPSHRCRTTTRR